MTDLERLKKLIEEELLDVHYQPILDLRTGEIFAYEALSRPGSAFGTPQNLIRAAVDAGEIGRLGRLQREIAVSGAAGWPVFLNIEPTEFDHGWLVRPDDPIFRHDRQVYLEITETVPLKFFEHCHSVLAEVRKKGARLAIDDLGAGFSNLKYISELGPDVVKLDRELVAGCLPGSRELGLLISITELCHEMNAEVVAEGVETLEELDSAIEAGVDYCQGNLFARPAPALPAIDWPEKLPPELLHRKIASAHAAREAEAEAVIEAAVEAAAEVPHDEVSPIVDPSTIKENTRELRVRLRKTARQLAESQRHRKALADRLEATVSLSGNGGREEARTEPQPAAPRRRKVLAFALTAAVSLVAGALVGSLLWPDARAKPASARGASPTAGSTPAPVAVEPPPGPAAPQPAGSLSQADLLEVVEQIEAWSEAWSEQRAEEYISYYGRRFRPPDGLDRAVWLASRRERIGAPSWIRVTLGPLEVVGLPSGAARARFEQTYESEGFRDEVVKTLELEREGGEWRIVAESSEPI